MAVNLQTMRTKPGMNLLYIEQKTQSITVGFLLNKVPNQAKCWEMGWVTTLEDRVIVTEEVQEGFLGAT